VGVGNCACALVQGLVHYADADEKSAFVPGLMHIVLGGYLVRDIEVVAAFDVNANKIGKDIAEAIWVSPNNAKKFSDVPETGVTVSPGFLGDGIAPHMQKLFPLREDPKEVTRVLKDSRAEMLISFLPVGSFSASRFYAQACLDTGLAFINGMPEFIASEKKWAEKFRIAGIPCAGDDVMSQFGATIVNRILLHCLKDRGLKIDESVQLNIGGNADFNNMTDVERVETKKISKAASLKFETGSCDVVAVPADYDPSFKDTKRAYITIKGKQFGGVDFKITTVLEVEDSPNSAGVIIDTIRLMKLSLDRGLSGYQPWSAYYFKRPAQMMSLAKARKIVKEFIA
jgi:myo-inositol-1-phosphate synthase